jgi:hypothetical protein
MSGLPPDHPFFKLIYQAINDRGKESNGEKTHGHYGNNDHESYFAFGEVLVC